MEPQGGLTLCHNCVEHCRSADGSSAYSKAVDERVAFLAGAAFF